MVAERVLSLGELNRALLARQMLLRRERVSVLEAVRRLVALQAQVVNPPYIGLWSRLHDFRREDLSELMQRRQVVRATLMRSTLQLMSAANYVRFRLALQPALTRAMYGFNGPNLKGLDIAPVVAAGHDYLVRQPRTFVEMRAMLAKLEPERVVESLAYVVRAQVPIVQVPPAGTWKVGGEVTYVKAEEWFGQPLVPAEEGLPELIRRYLAAFGPATVGDLQAWSGMSGLKGAVEKLRPQLRTFRDEKKRELFDLPDAPLPDAETPAPLRFIPDYDNLILAHDDRRRVMPEEHRKRVFLTAGRVRATFLVDGFVAGAWKIERSKKAARLVIEPFAPLVIDTRNELAAEGERLLRWAEDEATEFAVDFVQG